MNVTDVLLNWGLTTECCAVGGATAATQPVTEVVAALTRPRRTFGAPSGRHAPLVQSRQCTEGLPLLPGANEVTRRRPKSAWSELKHIQCLEPAAHHTQRQGLNGWNSVDHSSPSSPRHPPRPFLKETVPGAEGIDALRPTHISSIQFCHTLDVLVRFTGITTITDKLLTSCRLRDFGNRRAISPSPSPKNGPVPVIFLLFLHSLLDLPSPAHGHNPHAST